MLNLYLVLNIRLQIQRDCDIPIHVSGIRMNETMYLSFVREEKGLLDHRRRTTDES